MGIRAEDQPRRKHSCQHLISSIAPALSLCRVRPDGEETCQPELAVLAPSIPFESASSDEWISVILPVDFSFLPLLH
jgi:hypothetical protein